MSSKHVPLKPTVVLETHQNVLSVGTQTDSALGKFFGSAYGERLVANIRSTILSDGRPMRFLKSYRKGFFFCYIKKVV